MMLLLDCHIDITERERDEKEKKRELYSNGAKRGSFVFSSCNHCSVFADIDVHPRISISLMVCGVKRRKGTRASVC